MTGRKWPKCGARWRRQFPQVRHVEHRCHRAEGHYGPCECRCGLRDVAHGLTLPQRGEDGARA